MKNFRIKIIKNIVNKIEPNNKYEFDGRYPKWINLNAIIWPIIDEKIRLKRAIDRDNLEEETIKDRIRLQMKDDEKSEYSDYVIENNGSEFELFSKIDQIIEEIIWTNF